MALKIWSSDALHQNIHLWGPTLDLWNQNLEIKTHGSSFKQDMWVKQCWSLRTSLFNCNSLFLGTVSYLSSFYSQFLTESLRHYKALMFVVEISFLMKFIIFIRFLLQSNILFPNNHAFSPRQIQYLFFFN